MSGDIHINYLSSVVGMYKRTVPKSAASASKETATFDIQSTTTAISESRGTSDESATVKKSGHIQESLQKHPDWRHTVETHIAAGEKLKKSYPPDKTTSEMTMDEYKSYIGDLISRISVDASHFKDDISINISEEGWETMKDDPEYESWLLGHVSANLTFHNPWASYPGWPGDYAVDNFGASIEEHHGTSIGKSAPGSKDWYNSNSKDSFWEHRAKQHEEDERLAEKAHQRREYNRQLAQQAFEKHWRNEELLAQKLAGEEHLSAYAQLTNITALTSTTIMPSIFSAANA